ncbi:MAG: HK97 family phage prohead protease [Hyphomicrobiales bacterium]|nr:HK97 family phage prohead protease [Hyphomicrobiales bacterium]
MQHAKTFACADGRIQGYASLFGVADGAGDVVAPGAFRASLARRPASGVRMLFQHDPAQPVGVWDDIREDARGLYVRGRLTEGAAKSDDLRALLADGAIDGLSIGFRAVKSRRDAVGRRTLTEIDLWEVSIVTFPMLAAARIAARPALAVAGKSAPRAHSIRP